MAVHGHHSQPLIWLFSHRYVVSSTSSFPSTSFVSFPSSPGGSSRSIVPCAACASCALGLARISRPPSALVMMTSVFSVDVIITSLELELDAFDAFDAFRFFFRTPDADTWRHIERQSTMTCVEFRVQHASHLPRQNKKTLHAQDLVRT